MNVVQLQDMLRGLPDNRLKQELSQPTGTVPQYLVLSEVVRRDKMREATASAPQSTVLQDIIGTPQPAQQEPQAFANGGFITPAQAMGNAGVRGFEPQQQKQPMQFGFNSGGPQMFVPNTTPQPPAPVTNNNINVPPPAISAPAPQFDGGMNDGPNAPSFYEQPNGYADGGIIGLANGGPTPAMAELIRREAERLGIDPVDLATVISYETAGTFSPTIKGGAKTKWGEHIGLIQMGDPQREQYGYDPQGDLPGQMSAVGRYLEDRGVKPGMGLLDVYSTINAGAPGLYNRSDEAAGGAPGTVAEKVASQMEGHRAKAASLLGQPDQNQALDQEASATMMNPADRELGILSGGVMPDPRKRGIGSFFADALKAPGAQKDMRELGASLFAKSQENTAPEAPGITRGDASLVQSIGGKTPDQILAEYQALRQGYMANGGPVRMFNGGTPPPFQELTVDQILALPPAQQAEYFRQQERASQFERGGFKSRHLTEGAATANEAAARKKAEADRIYQEKILRGDTGLYRPSVETQVEAARGLEEGPAASAGQPNIPPAYNYMPESAAAAEETASKVRAAREGEARKALEAEQNKPSPFEEYLAYLKERDKQLTAEYKTQEEQELARQQEAGGLPFLLRQLGIGMIATGGNLGEGLRGGLGQAFSAREEQTQAARDKIRELQLKQRMAPLSGEEEIQKLRYEAAVAADKEARAGGISKEKYFEEANKLDAEIVKAIAEGATPESVAEMRQLAEMYRSLAGLPAQPGGLAGVPSGVKVTRE